MGDFMCQMRHYTLGVCYLIDLSWLGEGAVVSTALKYGETKVLRKWVGSGRFYHPSEGCGGGLWDFTVCSNPSSVCEKPRKGQDFASKSALSSGQLAHWAIRPFHALPNTAFGSCLQDLITPQTSLPHFEGVRSPWPEPSEGSMEKGMTRVTSEVTDPERHGLAMSLWEACSTPLDAQKPPLGFLGTDRLAEWESADARQLFSSSDPRWRPDSAPWGLPGGSPCAGPLDLPAIPSPPSPHFIHIADSASMG